MGALLRDGGFFQGRLVTSFYGYDVSRHPRTHGTGVYRELFRRGDLFIVTTNSMRHEVIALGCPQDKIIKHYPAGIDLAKFVFRPRTARPGEPIILLTVARLVEKKGIAYALRAAAKAKQDYSNLEYWIVGEGPLREPLEVLVSELGLTETVRMFGAQTEAEVLRLLSQAHLFLLPSATGSDGDEDSSPIALLEAQAAGLPVLSTLHCGIPEIVLDGESGWLVPERDVDALAAKLCYLVERPQIWPKMGGKGRGFVEKYFSADRLSDRSVEIYQGLLTGELMQAI